MRWPKPQSWLRIGATICLVAGWLGAGGMAANGTKSPRRPLVVDNPFAAAKVATPEAPPAPVVTADETTPILADETEGFEPEVNVAEANVAEAHLAESEAESLPVYRLPRVEADEWIPENNSPAQPEEVYPLPAEPSPEMLRDMDDVLTQPFAVERQEPIDPAGAIPYTPAADGLSAQQLPAVRKAYSLAQRGALYAAEAEFIQVLRRIAQAKDAAQGTDEHSKALAAGLRALDEADDFAPGGVQLEAEMNVGVIVSSHRTPALDGRMTPVLPQEAIALYHQFSQQQLARAAGNEQAGSMALYGLGKMQCRLANDDDNALRHEQKAVTLFLASLDAGPDNHLAANEVGVLLTRSGHPVEAADMFKRAIDITPNSTAYHNLAMVEQKLGQYEQANANEQYAQQLAASDRAAGSVSRSKGVQWVSPQELARANSSQQPPQLQTPRGPSSVGSAGTVARWPQKLVPNAFRR